MPGEVSRNHPMSDLDDWERAFWDDYRRGLDQSGYQEGVPEIPGEGTGHTPEGTPP